MSLHNCNNSRINRAVLGFIMKNEMNRQWEWSTLIVTNTQILHRTSITKNYYNMKWVLTQIQLGSSRVVINQQGSSLLIRLTRIQFNHHSLLKSQQKERNQNNQRTSTKTPQNIKAWSWRSTQHVRRPVEPSSLSSNDHIYSTMQHLQGGVEAGMVVEELKCGIAAPLKPAMSRAVAPRWQFSRRKWESRFVKSQKWGS